MNVEPPLAIDLFTGLHGWAEGLIEKGWRVVGFDIEDMCAQFDMPRPAAGLGRLAHQRAVDGRRLPLGLP